MRAAGVAQVFDVRAFPKSRRHPQFWREDLERWLPELGGSAYAWTPALGGFRKSHAQSANVALRNASFRAYADYMETDDFVSALDDVLSGSSEVRSAVMCSETLWWRCHRRLIADAATLLRGVDVRHLGHDGKLAPHVLTSGVRVASPTKLRYDAVDAGADGPRHNDEPESLRTRGEAGNRG